jgi:hypothetical protein
MAVTDGRKRAGVEQLCVRSRPSRNRSLDYALRALKQAPGNPSVMDTAGGC